MQPIDFSCLLDSSTALATLPTGVKPNYSAYELSQGLQLLDRNQDLFQEFVRIADDALLLASDCRSGAREHRQAINGSDWVHIQFRLSGGGREWAADENVIETPENSCIVARYLNNSIIERSLESADRWRAVCLLMTPKALAQLIGSSESPLSPSTQWLTADMVEQTAAVVLPLQSNVVLAVNDIFSCQLQGRARHIYMRAKTLELLSVVVDALERQAVGERHAVLRLSAPDLRRISLARMIMIEELDSSITLAQLARRVGLNRTKLALGFKQVFGMSVQAYWRDRRLSQARALLQERGARVTDVAHKMGYSELSSFTRAFSRKFGVLPRQCRDIVDVAPTPAEPVAFSRG
jgi:AraC family transcriptional regulator, transcriptional activator of the genes for pyochelin and ferripyochelin receptors